MSIPNIIHQIWVGDTPIPQKSLEYIEKIRELHPEYEYRLWKNDDITSDNFLNYLFIINCSSNAQKADIMRYEILYKYGGIYLDIDMQVFKCLTPLLTHSLVVCNEDNNINEYMSIGFIACELNNSQLLNCVASIKNIDFRYPVNKATGPYYFRRCINLDHTVKILPTITCYPTHWRHKNIIPEIKKDVFMWHHWDKNW